MTSPSYPLSEFPSAGNGLVIVAHPDDEVIWCGGLILQHPGVTWTIISLCRGSDPDRRPRFHSAVNVLGATGVILDVDDGPALRTLALQEDIIAPLLDVLPAIPWQLCITHGENGEYGHQRHIDTHRAVTTMLKEGILPCDQLYCFAYQRCDNGLIEHALNATVSYQLSSKSFDQKRTIIRDIYGFGDSSFEWNACLPVESFYNPQFS